MKPLAVTIPEAVQLTGISRSTIYEALKRREIAARKCGRRTLLLYTDLEAYVSSLPPFRAEE